METIFYKKLRLYNRLTELKKNLLFLEYKFICKEKQTADTIFTLFNSKTCN